MLGRQNMATFVQACRACSARSSSRSLPSVMRAPRAVFSGVRRVHARMNDQGVDYSVQKSPKEWRAELSDMQYHVLREKGTERPGTGEYNKFYPPDGHFACAGCGQPLYSAAAKFDSGCGWPAFDKIVEGSVVTETDTSFGMKRVEIMCSGCGGHLGHVFEGERLTPTNERHCVNSLSIKYVDAPLGEGKAETKVLLKKDGAGGAETASSILAQLLGDK